MKTPTIDLRLVHAARGDVARALRIAAARRQERSDEVWWRYASGDAWHAYHREMNRKTAEAYKRRVDEWSQLCLDLKSEAWKNGTPDQVSLPECPRPFARFAGR